MINNPKERAKELLKELSVDEKIYQLSGEMLFDVGGDYEKRRNPMHGNYRNPGHFIHATVGKPVSPSEVAKRINRDVKLSIEAQPHKIPPIQHGEALHGAQWGMATVFPQPISMASTFDDEIVAQIADAIGKECAAVGVRQALSPVINIVRDCRWGRTIETYGEDVLLNCNMGVAMCKGLEQNGVIATPKHFVDNYAHGGRDSNASETSERTLREVYLKPFEKCIKEGKAQSLMAAYNSWDGVPCSCNETLLNDILREEWGFEGFVVSDYCGMEGVASAHHYMDEEWMAQAKCVQAGLEVNLPFHSYEKLKKAYDEGVLTDEDLDKAVLRVLTAKFKIGLFDAPYVDEEKADKIVRCEAHRQISLQAARESIVLLKNEETLPLKKEKIKKIAVFGASANEFPVGHNYTGPYQVEWTAEGVQTPLEYLKQYLGEDAEVIFATDDNIDEVAGACDVAFYFTTVVEGEGMDRSDIRLPSYTGVAQVDENALIVDKREVKVNVNQEESIRKMTSVNRNSVVVLLNGAPVDMSYWMDGCGAIVEAWYPGEQGAQAICEILFGEFSPSAKLPISFPKSVGQLPLFYAHKPSGRGYGYNENDGKPLYPFGYGLSYTQFELSNFAHEVCDNKVKVQFDMKNIGDCDGAEVVQIYLAARNCDVVMPMKELKAYKRIHLKKQQKERITIEVPEEAFFYYNQKMKYGMHNGDYGILVGTSSEHILNEFKVKVRGKQIIESGK